MAFGLGLRVHLGTLSSWDCYTERGTPAVLTPTRGWVTLADAHDMHVHPAPTSIPNTYIGTTRALLG